MIGRAMRPVLLMLVATLALSCGGSTEPKTVNIEGEWLGTMEPDPTADALELQLAVKLNQEDISINGEGTYLIRTRDYPLQHGRWATVRGTIVGSQVALTVIPTEDLDSTLSTAPFTLFGTATPDRMEGTLEGSIVGHATITMLWQR